MTTPKLPSIRSTLDGDDPGSSPISVNQPYSHHLVLHFDINETILVGDEAGGDTREDCINKMIAKSCWVQCPEELRPEPHRGGVTEQNDSTSMMDGLRGFTPTHWHNGEAIWEDDAPDDDKEPPFLYTGWDWPPGCCPYYRTASRRVLQVKYSPLAAHIDEQLALPSDAAKTCNPALSHMLPGFFDTLVALSERPQSWTLVFRTFGTDLPDIAAAVSAFAKGEHPSYPDFSNPRLILTPNMLYQGHWRRDDDGEDHTYELYQDDRVVASGDAQVLDLLHQQTVCGIQDDYSFWNQNNCEPWSGKPVWMLPDVQHILLDDNIHHLVHDSIASVQQRRDSDNTGEPPSFHTLSGHEILEQQGVHLIRVPTVAPILDRNWFLRAIDDAQERFNQRRRARLEDLSDKDACC